MPICNTTSRSLGGGGKEAQPIQLLLNLPLKLVIARIGSNVSIIEVIIKVVKGDKEGMLLGHGPLKTLLFERLPIESPLDLCLSVVCLRSLELYSPFLFE